METLKKKAKILLIFAIVAGVCFVVGMPTMIVCIIKNKSLGMTIGILLTVYGFYGITFLLAFYYFTRVKIKMLKIILEVREITIEELSESVNLFLPITKRVLIGFLKKGFLEDLSFDGNKIYSK